MDIRAALRACHLRSLRLFICLALLCSVVGCQTAAYYSQAVRGQIQLWSGQKPIHDLLRSDNTSPELKDRLRLILELRQFAEAQLQLPADGHYLKYTDLGRRFVVWNVYAAPEFSLAPKSWWYPVVGSLDYRGYFNESKARAYAHRLRDQGLDVYVGGVTAYSTLGWFHDPVLNTFLFESDADVAELIFHELAHQRLFIPGDTEFNEAFATAVAEEGTRRWMKGRNDPAALREYQIQAHRTEEFVSLVTEARARLEALFATSTDRTNSSILPVEELRAKKERILDELRKGYSELRGRWGNTADYDTWFSRPLNNAQLNTVDTYYKLVPLFRSVLRTCDGDLDQFYRSVASLKTLTQAERRARLAEFASSTVRPLQKDAAAGHLPQETTPAASVQSGGTGSP